MPFFYRCRQMSILMFCLGVSYATNPASAQAPVRIHYKVIREALIVVPVSINNSAPLDFLLDTGTSRTIVDQSLASELRLKRIGKSTLSGIQGSASTDVVRTDSVSMAGQTVEALEVTPRSYIPFDLRGVLGEDFLRNFNLLIDNRHHSLEFEPVTLTEGGARKRSLVSTLSGEHLPINLQGLVQGEPTRNRLTVAASANELGGKPLTLQLDSGSNLMMIFHQAAGHYDSWGSKLALATSLFGDGASMSINDGRLKFLQIGSQVVQNVQVSGSDQIMDVDGILPTVLFKSIFICHSGKFAILNPSRSDTAR